MRKIAMLTACVVLLCLGVAQAESAVIGNPDQAVEQMLFFRIVQQANLDSGSMAEIFDGYTRYHAMMDPLLTSREKMTNEVKEAAAANKGGYELKEKLNALLELDRQIFEANQEAIKAAGTVVNPAVLAQLYLLVYNRESMIAEARSTLAGPCACTTLTPAAAPAAVPVAVPAVPAAAPVAEKEVAPEEAIMAVVKTFSEKLAAKDVKGVMGLVSDKFTNMEYGDKAGLQDFVQNAADAGYLDGLEVVLKGAGVKVEGDKAKVQPVEVNGSFGGATLELHFGKVDGAWTLVGLNIEGV